MNTVRAGRRLATLCLAVLAGTHLLVASTVAAAAGPPALIAVQPGAVVVDGQPLKVALEGSNLSTTVGVELQPAVPGLSFTVVNDSILILTLPASVAPDYYSVVVIGTGGTSDASQAPTFVVTTTAAAAAPVAPAAPTQAPDFTFAPYPNPNAEAEPTTGVIPSGGATVDSSASTPRPLNPILLVPLGVVLGGLGFLLWGRPGRLAAADRQGLGAHFIGRPVQALHIGRICLQCGRLHFILKTRRDLWQAGQFCSATCFVAAQEDDSAAKVGESTAVTRMREMFVYSELEQGLQAALAGDLHTSLEVVHGSAAEPVDESATGTAPGEDEQEPLVKASAAS